MKQSVARYICGLLTTKNTKALFQHSHSQSRFLRQISHFPLNQQLSLFSTTPLPNNNIKNKTFKLSKHELKPNFKSESETNTKQTNNAIYGLTFLFVLLYMFKDEFLKIYNFKVSAAKPTYDEYIGKSGNNSSISGGGGKKPPNARNMFNFLADVVSKVSASVVCIEVKDHNVVDFSGVPRSVSNGSGFIVKEDGLILTNAHVVYNGSSARKSIGVRLPDGRTFHARIEDMDVNSDLATLRINSRGLPTMNLGQSSETRLGEFVLAIGSPLSLSNSVTHGVVSSVDRQCEEIGLNNDIKYIQTDAAITFGNSGGPLVNLDGEAIGVNSMKVAAGISFAIPIDHAKKFLEAAEKRKKTGKTKSRYMGVTMLTLTDEIIAEIGVRGGHSGYSISQGVIILKVVVGSPAYLAGLKPGDIVVQINNNKIMSAADVYEILKTADTLIIHAIRGDKTFSFKVTPEDVY